MRGGSPAGTPRARRTGSLWRTGYSLLPGYADEARCAALLAAVERCRASVALPIIARAHGGRSLRYQVIDGPTVQQYLPELEELQREVQQVAEAAYGQPLVPIADPLAVINVNITPPGGTYRWHYDRNAVTVLLYLNAVEGGQLELCPRYRVLLGRGRSGLIRVAQRALDRVLLAAPLRRLFGQPVLLAPTRGTLAVMQGDRCLHSVRPVEGARERSCIVVSFDPPGSGPAPTAAALNTYLYSTASVGRADPNYQP